MTTGAAAAAEMPLIHRIFRRQFAEVADLVTQVDPTEAGRIAAVATHLEFLLHGLHLHHTTEDDLIWPTLLQRVGDDAPAVARMEGQHQGIDEAVARVRSACAAWTATPTTPTALAEEIGSFLAVLEAHLDEEEREVVPLIDLHLSDAEWQEVGEKAFEKFTPAQRWIAMGQLVEVATDEEVARMFGTLPPPVKILWRLVGRRRYRRYIAPVRGQQR